MNVLVACEFSGVVRDAFREAGHNAWSCDLLSCERDKAHHILGDVRLLSQAHLATYDLMIAHPPCTYLARSGARWWAGKEREQARALDFVRWLMAAPIARIAIENPPGRIGTAIRPADQYVQPWWFGHGETKMTGLWLKNLPPLTPTDVVEGREPRTHLESPGPDRWKNRSRTVEGIARAMATQWGRAAAVPSLGEHNNER